MSNIQLALQTGKPLILAAAAQGSDPGSYAGMILDHISDEDVDKCMRPDSWWTGFLQMIPEAAPYQEWFTELRNTMLEMLQPEPGSGNVVENQPTTAAPNDATAGTS